MKRAIVVYFSATGTTEGVARRLAAVTHADTMAIEPAQPYTSADLDWTNNHSRSTLEMKNPKSRPAIKTPEKSLDAYDVVFLGYPIWWDLAPTVVNTFIESQHLDGKVVVPFATSGGSGINHSAVQLKKQYPNIKWRERANCSTHHQMKSLPSGWNRWVSRLNELPHLLSSEDVLFFPTTCSGNKK